MFLTSTAMTRHDAETLLVDDHPLTVGLLSAITSTSPDAAFATGCCPDTCNPDAVVGGCLMAHTKERRLANWAVDGLGDWQQIDGPTRFHAHDWSSGTARLVEPLYEGGEPSPGDALFMIEVDIIGWQHVFHFEQRLWLMPNLIVAATSTERHPNSVHTITPCIPRRPRRR